MTILASLNQKGGCGKTSLPLADKTPYRRNVGGLQDWC